MAVPAAPLELNGDKILFGTYDNAGTNAAAVLRSFKQSTVNTTVLGELGVYGTSGNLENGNMTVTSTTAFQLSSTTVPCQGVIVKAHSDNAATIYVGKSDVTADQNNTTGGYPLEPGESVGVPCRNLTEVYVRGTTNDGVSFIASTD